MNVLVNEKKAKRARMIVDILGRTPKNSEEKELKETFALLVKEEKVIEKNVLEFVYTKLGGLVRTEVEHNKEVAKSKQIKKDIAEGRKVKK